MRQGGRGAQQSATAARRQLLFGLGLSFLLALTSIIVLITLSAPWWSIVIAVGGFVLGAVGGLVKVLPGIKKTSVQPRVRPPVLEPYLPPAQVRLPPRNFSGRDNEVAEIFNYFSAELGAHPRLIHLVGPAGIGKTALATYVAELWRDEYPDGQLFAQMGAHPEGLRHANSPRIHEILHEFVSALQLGEKPPTGIIALANDYARFTRHRKILVIIDDVCHAECVTPLLPAGSFCATIVTSRSAVVGLPGYRLSLGPLATSDAVDLLGSVVGEQRVINNRVAAEYIAGAGHPLAVRLSGTALSARPYWPLDRAVSEMAGQRPLPADAPQDVRAGTLDLSYALLTEDERRALRCIGLLNQPGFVPWQLAALLKADWEYGPKLSDEPIPEDLEVVAERLGDSLAQAQLLRRSSGDEADVAQFMVHEHVLQYARARMEADTSADKRSHMREALASAGRLRHQATGLRAQVKFLVPQMQDAGRLTEALGLARSCLASARDSGRLDDEALALATLADLQVELGNTAEARELAEAACRLESVVARARALRCLGKAMRRIRSLGRARDYLAQALEDAVRTGDVAEQIKILIEQSVVLSLGHDSGTGMAAADLAVGLCEDNNDDSHLIAQALWARGRVLLESGDPTAARLVLIEAAREALDHKQTLCQAWTAWLQGETEVAARDYKAAAGFAADAVDLFGAMAHRYGAAFSRLLRGRVYAHSRRQLDESISLLSEALETFQNCGDSVAEAQARRELVRALIRRLIRHRGIRFRHDIPIILGLLRPQQSSPHSELNSLILSLSGRKLKLAASNDGAPGHRARS